MDLVNETGLEAAWIVSQIEPPQHALTALVKGTFRLQHGEAAVLAEEQLPLTGDTFEADDPARSLRYAFDFAPFKPRADVLLVGTCYPPGGRPAQSVKAGLRLGSLSKTLLVVGDRFWTGLTERLSGSGTVTAPRLFESMPLNWEHAYGGRGYESNPIGKGRARVERPDTGALAYPLPNIEHLDRPMRAPADEVPPAGFGPLPDTWPQRLKKFGSFNSRYLKERWPWYPRDFDWAYFNTAPPDQQMDGFLHGDEALVVDNVHAAIPRFECRLPGLRARVFLYEEVRAGEELREIPLKLDTLWVDMDAELIVLVWRGNVPVRSEKLLELLHFFVVTEPLAEPPVDEEGIRFKLYETLERRAQEEELELEDEPEAEELDEAEDEEEVEAAGAETGDAEQAEAEPESGTAPAPAVAKPTAADAGETAEHDEDDNEAVETDDEEALTIDRVRQKIANRESFAGCDLTGLSLAELDFSGLDFREAIFERSVLVRANFTGADLRGAVLTGANLREAKLTGAKLIEADLTQAWLVRADLTGADLTGVEAPQSCLRGAKMRGTRAGESVFTEADFSDADLEGACLAEADLCGARMHRTNFAQGNLNALAIEGAWGRQVIARGASIAKVRGAGAWLCEADLRESCGEQAVWEEAQLFAANFTGAQLPEAEFSGAYLGRAVFDAADVKGSRFEEAHLGRARMVRCNLLGASLAKADLSSADLAESNLFGATLMDSKLDNTNFHGANLRRIKSREAIA
jgi:uncharacterized protein YjbI with pentapeptide repeats